MTIEIRDVWEDNLVEEFELIGDIVDRYPYVSLDTEFPGDVVKSPGYFREPSDKFGWIRENGNRLKLIQLGLTFSNGRGVLPRFGINNGFRVWQFNFCEFDPNNDEHDPGSIAMLRGSGIDLERNQREGVTSEAFGELLMGSAALMNPDVTWLSFDGGKDFGYLLKLLQGKMKEESKFAEALSAYCPVMYDVKHLMTYTNSLHGGLNNLAGMIGVRRFGVSHQAGSDSLLTSDCYFTVRDGGYLPGDALSRSKGVLDGLRWYS